MPGFFKVIRIGVKNMRQTFKKGSVTLETALSFTVFIGFTLFVIGFLMVVGTKASMQIHINNIAQNTAKNMFYAETLDEITDATYIAGDIKSTIVEEVNELSDQWFISYLEEGAEVTYLETCLMSESEVENYVASEFLCDVKDIDLSRSSIEDGVVDIILEYGIRIPLIGSYMTVSQRARVKDWTGESVENEKNIVYITKSGTVYHKSRDCSHLVLHITSCTYSLALSGLNSYGKKYTACEYCVSNVSSAGTTVFITKEGEKYHSSLQCQSITRRIEAVELDQVGDKTACSECAS